MDLFKALPSTPRVGPTAPIPSPTASPSPGTWRHPKFAEIQSRHNASTFTEQDFSRAALNSIALVLSFTFGSELHSLIYTFLRAIPTTPASTATCSAYIVLAFRLYLLFNISFALAPLSPYRQRDTWSDIPLTPSQRALMGLSPLSSPAKRDSNAKTTPIGSSTNSPAPSPSPNYYTPPRYKRRSFSTSPSPLGDSPTGNISSSASGSIGTPSSIRSTSATYAYSSPLASRTPLGDISPFDSTQSHHYPGFRASTSFSTSNSPLSMSLFSSHPPPQSTPASRSGSPLLQRALISSTTYPTRTREGESNATRNNMIATNPFSSLSRNGSPLPPKLPPPPSLLHRSQSLSTSTRKAHHTPTRSHVATSLQGHSRGLDGTLNYKWLFEKERRNQSLGGVVQQLDGSGSGSGSGLGLGGTGGMSRSESLQF